MKPAALKILQVLPLPVRGPLAFRPSSTHPGDPNIVILQNTRHNARRKGGKGSTESSRVLP
jgi:hypothetical protein